MFSSCRLFSGVLCLDLSEGEDILLAGDHDGAVAVWSLVDRELVHMLLGHTGQRSQGPYRSACHDNNQLTFRPFCSCRTVRQSD